MGRDLLKGIIWKILRKKILKRLSKGYRGSGGGG